jgi:uncharacterized protein (TIGR03000 family)
MLRSLVLLLGPALACGLALVAPAPARAAPYHGGHAHYGGGVGHYHGGVAHYGGGFGHYGGYGHYGHYGHGYYGHHHGGGFGLSIGLGFGYGGFGYGGYGYGLGYPGYYSGYYASYPAYYSYYPAYDYTYPAYAVEYSPPVITTAPAVVAPDPPVIAGTTVVAPPAPAGDVAAKPNAAQMEVRVPEADADVWVDGRPTKAKGRTRILVSPELVPGKAYSYKVTAAFTRDGKRVAEDRVVDVAAGQTSLVDFTAANGGDDLPFPKERPAAKVPPAVK